MESFCEINQVLEKYQLQGICSWKYGSSFSIHSSKLCVAFGPNPARSQVSALILEICDIVSDSFRVAVFPINGIPKGKRVQEGFRSDICKPFRFFELKTAYLASCKLDGQGLICPLSSITTTRIGMSTSYADFILASQMGP